MRYVLILLPFLFLLSGCSDYWVVQRSENFVSQPKSEGQKIVCLGASISYMDRQKNYDREAMQKLTDKFNSALGKYAKKNGLELELLQLDQNLKPEFYDELIALKQNLVEVNFNNYASANSSGGSVANKLSKNVFVYAPKVSYDFNNLSKSFGTKYFSYVKVSIGSESFTFHHVLVDTDLSETVYSERKVINHKYKEAKLRQVIYDSFNVLAQELKK